MINNKTDPEKKHITMETVVLSWILKLYTVGTKMKDKTFSL